MPRHAVWGVGTRGWCRLEGRAMSDRALAVLSLLALTMAHPARGRTITVDEGGSGDHTRIQAAVDAAADGDTVVVADGVYTGPGNRDIDFRGKAITVRSERGPGQCVIDCGGSEEDPHRGFHFHTGEGRDSVLEGFTITNGHIAGSDWPESAGGAIYCGEPRCSPTIRNNRIVGNKAFYGGGICYFGSPRILDNLIAENEAREGGGINAYEQGGIARNTIVRNRAERGGGIMVWEDYAPAIQDNIIQENAAEGDGGGIGVYNTSPWIIGNLVVGNEAGGRGGGMHLASEPRVNAYNTIVGNTAALGGGVSGASNLVNCIVWGNTPQSSLEDATYSCIEGWAEDESNIFDDPRFVDPGNGDYHLRPDSPCIDAGMGAVFSAPAFDLDGNERPCGGEVDMGVYESCGARFRRGDGNADGRSSLIDVIMILLGVFSKDVDLPCEKSADFDDNGKLELLDAVHLLQFIFSPDPRPPRAPFPGCGGDPSSDNLTCRSYGPCG